MAGDWIKMRTDLADDPAVIVLSESCGLDPDTVVGKLHRLWSWADKHTADGNAVGVTYAFLDRYLSVPGFAEIMEQVGWLTTDGAVLTIPNFDKHNGQSAKKRCLTAQRKAKCVERKGNARSVTKTFPREEKRRDSNTPLPPLSENRLSEPLAKAADDWLAYRGKAFKPRAYTAFITRIQKRAAMHGEAAVIDAMQRAMSQGYKGWDFDEWFEKRSTGQPPPGKQFLEVTPDEFKRLRDLDAFKIRPYREPLKDGRVRWSGQKRDGTKVECFIEGATT